MQKELRRYLFIGDFDSFLLGLFSKRGEVIWVSSLEEALNQTGNFSIIMIESMLFYSRDYKGAVRALSSNADDSQ